MSTTTKLKAELRKQLVELKSAMDEITRNGIKAEGENVTVSPEAAKAFREKMAEAKGLREQLSAYGEYEQLDAYLNDPGAESVATRSNGQSGGLIRPNAYKSLGARFIESPEFKNRLHNGTTQNDFVVDEDLTTLQRKDIYTAAGGTLTRFGFGTVEQEPLVQRPYRTDRVRDLFPVANTTSNLIEYMRVMGYLGGANNARTVPEREGTEPNATFGLKPQTKLQFTPQQAPVRTIAHWEAAHRNTLDDEPMLRSIIDNELLYGLRLVEDDQFLNGDGAGENLLGILRTPGIQIYPNAPFGDANFPGEATDTYIDAIRRAATRVMLAYYDPTGVVVHPYDWERMELTKDAQRGYVLALNVAVGAEKRIWQMPVVASPAMTQGTALVGAFGLGAKIYDRQQSNIRVSEQHEDFFVRNAVVILAEQRVGLTVSRPEAFVKINLEDSIDTTP